MSNQLKNMGNFISEMITSLYALQQVHYKLGICDKGYTNETTPCNDLISSLDTEEPTVKRRRPFISWLFHKGSVPHKDQVCTAPPVVKTGKIFGKDLTAICEDGNLPTAILDILSFISVRGPITEGIFSTPGKIRAFLSLKERLDSGTEVNLNNGSVPVVASILKEFLRNIPGSVLTSRQYDEWLGVLDPVYEEKEVAAVQSLLEQLPQPNVILLKPLFRILYKIERNSEFNHMTSSHLAICIALCILCLPSSCNSRLADITKKVSLVKFLIENYPKIFGEELIYENSEEHVKMSLISLMITWASATSQDNMCLIPPAPNEEPPTGNSDNPPTPNKELLVDGNLPTPVLDMLSIIEEKGLHTEKIFRTIANKSFRTLKEKLDDGEEVSLTEESVLVVASVLKGVESQCLQQQGGSSYCFQQQEMLQNKQGFEILRYSEMFSEGEPRIVRSRWSLSS
ncbi:rho GTPase-activating protein 20-like [Peromyscus eremicus]|uniref:rho GTPase-activating protein 20-like n=1 Tax=Peromyscus eremicus TaxID=42410 RepID=UPI0027DC109D|nr:rho GTPase-activating protein 20-like [Peromyscus eremicus]